MLHSLYRQTPKAIAIAMLALAAWIGYRQVGAVTTPPIEISIFYSPEGDPFLPQVIETFNASFAKGINPMTGKSLAQTEPPIRVSGQSITSGTTHQGIINAILAPTNSNVARPTIFSPSTSIWLTLVNHATQREIFNLKESPAIGYGAVVIAIWESRLKSIQAKYPNQPIGWEELLALMKSPNGWNDYGIAGRSNVYYGHTDPYVSSTGLTTLIAEFSASARYNLTTTHASSLTPFMINDPAIQQGVREIEAMIKHYSSRTTEMRQYIAQGPEYVDFIALQEDALIYINQGKAGFTPRKSSWRSTPKKARSGVTIPLPFPTPTGLAQNNVRQRASLRIMY